MKTNQVILHKEPIELYKLLKFEGLAASGGEAKMVIEQGFVKVNNETETRKRRKLYQGDVVEYEDHQLQLILQEKT